MAGYGGGGKSRGKPKAALAPDVRQQRAQQDRQFAQAYEKAKRKPMISMEESRKGMYGNKGRSLKIPYPKLKGPL